MNTLGATAIVPAAGRSERFGGMKLLADIDGEPLIARTIRSLFDAGIEHIVVVCAPVPFGTAAVLEDARVTRVTNPDPARGMFSSIQAGLASAVGDPIVILPADMPFVANGTIARVVDEARRHAQVVVPRYHGRGGHPIALPLALREALLHCDPMLSLKHALTDIDATFQSLEVDDPGILRDVDVRGDLRG